MHRHLDKKSSYIMARSNRVGIDFLLADLNTGLAVLRIALATDPGSRNRQFDNAFKVYRTVVQLLPKFVLAPHEESEIKIKLEDLRGALEGAGFQCEI